MRGAVALSAVAGALAFSSSHALAQVVDSSTAVRVPRADSVKLLPPPKIPAVRNTALAALRAPPITPKRAFLYSLMIPGWGQSRLDRGTAGALFAAIELGSLAMVGKTTIDLKQARRYSVDSLPGTYTVNADGKLVPGGSAPPPLPSALVNTRRLHREDWFAALLFNHLISGADAFVAAQLWDVPTTFSVKSRGDAVALVATVHW